MDSHNCLSSVTFLPGPTSTCSERPICLYVTDDESSVSLFSYNSRNYVQVIGMNVLSVPM